MHIMGFEGCSLASLWYVYLKVLFFFFFCDFVLQQSTKSFPLGFIETPHKLELLKG